MKEAVMRLDGISSNKNVDIDALVVQFKRMKVKIRQLNEALTAQHISLLQMNEARLQVALKVSALAEDSAIFKEAGRPIPVQGNQPTASDLSSYAAVHSSINIRQRMSTDCFLKHVVDYALEWENLIIAPVSASLKHSESLLRDLDHYQEKFEWMTLEVNRITSKGKVVDERVAARLRRNEKKLQQARKDYNIFASNLCLVLEEVTAKGWQNLHPILLKLIQFDIKTASDEDQLLSNLTPVAESLKKIATEFGLQQSQVINLDILDNLTALQLTSSKTAVLAKPKESRRILQNAASYHQNNMKSGKHGTKVNIPTATLVK